MSHGVHHPISRGLVLGLAALVPLSLAVRHSLHRAEHWTTEPVLDAVSALVDHPTMEVLLPEPERAAGKGLASVDGEELRHASLRLASSWRSMGHPCRVRSRGAVDSEARVMDGLGPAGGQVICSGFPEDPGWWEAIGLKRTSDEIRTPGGQALPIASVSVAITLVRGQIVSPGSRWAAMLATGEGTSKAGVVTYVLGSLASPRPMAAALDALALRPPQLVPGVVLWCDGQRLHEVALDQHGHVKAGRIEWPLVASTAPADGGYQDILDRARRISDAVADLEPVDESSARRNARSAAQLTIHEAISIATSIATRARDGAVQRAGWYDGAERRLVVLPGVASSTDDALFAFAEAEFLRVLGAPETPWFARGMAYNLIGSCGGFALDELEKRTGAVTPDEVFSPGHARTRLALAPAEARLARRLVGEFGGSVADAWRVRVEDDADLQSRLRERWTTRLAKVPVLPKAPVQRALPPGVHVELTVGLGGKDWTSLRAELERISRLGFQGVSLPLHVVVAPPGVPERRRRGAGWQRWGSHVSMDGDGAVLAAAVMARDLGLSVTLAPRFLSGESAGLGRRQIHGSTDRIRLYGDRRALAMEGVAWLAEQAMADAVVAFDSAELPGAQSTTARAEDVIAARRVVRRQSLVYSGPFAGERVAFARNREQGLLVLDELDAAFPEGPLGHVQLRVGQDVAPGVHEKPWVTAKRRLESLDRSSPMDAIFVANWFSKGGRGGKERNLGAAPDPWLRTLSRSAAESGPR